MWLGREVRIPLGTGIFCHLVSSAKGSFITPGTAGSFVTHRRIPFCNCRLAGPDAQFSICVLTANVIRTSNKYSAQLRGARHGKGPAAFQLSQLGGQTSVSIPSSLQPHATGQKSLKDRRMRSSNRPKQKMVRESGYWAMA